jgi:uncharacterized protein involved in exopolysaccharide biosynthesis
VNTASATEETHGELTALDLLIVLAENVRLLIAIPVVIGVVSFGITYTIPPTYVATTRVLPPTQQQSPSAAMVAQLTSIAGFIGAGASPKNPTDQYASLLRARTIADALIQRFNLKEHYGVEYLVDARKALHKRTKITAGARDGIIVIDVEDEDPKRAAALANAFVEELGKLSSSLAITEAAQRRAFFETQFRRAHENLGRAETALRGSSVSEAVLKTVPQAAIEALARLKAQITAQEIKLASMRTFMTESNPDFRLAMQELFALRAELAKAEQNNASKTLGQGGDYVGRYRDFKYHEALFDLIAKQHELARMDEAREGTTVQVIDDAAIPERKAFPRRSVVVVVAMIAALALITLVLFIRAMISSMAGDVYQSKQLARLRQSISFRRGKS